MTDHEAMAQLRDKTELFAGQLAAWDRRIIEIVAIGGLAKESISPKEAIELVCTFEPEPSDESLGFFTLVNLLARDDHEHASEKLGIPNTVDLGFKMGGKVYLPNGVILESPDNSITLWERRDEPRPNG